MIPWATYHIKRNPTVILTAILILAFHRRIFKHQ